MMIRGPLSELSPRETILARVLAFQDAAFTPMRTFDRPRPANTLRARLEAVAMGFLWKSEGQDEARRKMMQRALEGLNRAKLVVSRRPRRGGPRVRLTLEGDELARQTCGLPGLAYAYALMTEIERVAGQRSVLETVLAGTHYNEPGASDALMNLERMALPGLVRDWLRCSCTVGRAAIYHLDECGIDGARGRARRRARGARGK